MVNICNCFTISSLRISTVVALHCSCSPQPSAFSDQGEGELLAISFQRSEGDRKAVDGKPSAFNCRGCPVWLPLFHLAVLLIFNTTAEVSGDHAGSPLRWSAVGGRLRSIGRKISTEGKDEVQRLKYKRIEENDDQVHTRNLLWLWSICMLIFDTFTPSVASVSSVVNFL